MNGLGKTILIVIIAIVMTVFTVGFNSLYDNWISRSDLITVNVSSICFWAGIMFAGLYAIYAVAKS